MQVNGWLYNSCFLFPRDHLEQLENLDHLDLLGEGFVCLCVHFPHDELNIQTVSLSVRTRSGLFFSYCILTVFKLFVRSLAIVSVQQCYLNMYYKTDI